MADFELFNGTNLEEPDADHRIAMNKPSLAGAFFVRWDNFKNLIRSFTVSKDTDQSISGNKTFTGIVNVQAPTSDNNPVTLKYFNDNVGSEEIIEVATYANLPLVGVISVLYVVLDENVQYRWSGTVYIAMSSPLSYASQAEMEVTPAVENTKVITPLRAWEGFVFWCKNTLFPELNTSDKTIIGSVNELKTNVVKLETDETPAAITDTDNVRFKSGTGWYNRTLLEIKNYVKSGLKASEVANDSTKVTGATVKDIFDNAEEAVLATTVQDSDMFAGMRWENIGTGIETYNKYWTAEDMKAYFATSGALIAYVSTDSELSDALAAEKETMQICATAGITSGSISNVYAGNLWITGRKLIFDSGLIVPNSLSSRAVTRVFFDASVTMLGDDIDGACVFAATAGIWHFTFRNLSQDMPIKFVAAGTSEIHVVCGNTITIDPTSTGKYTVTQDSTLDLGQDGIRLDGSNVFNEGTAVDASTEVLIKANTGFVTLATVQKLSEQALLYSRRALVVTIDRKVGDPTMYDLCDILIGWEIEYIDIVRKDNLGGQDYLIFACEDGGGNFIDISSAVGVQSTPNRTTRLHYLSSFPSTELYDFYKLDMIFINKYNVTKKLRVRVGGGYWDVSTLEFRVVIKRTL